MTATSKNIELIVKQWTTFDLKTIQHDLDVTTTEIASRADESDQSRRKLVELSREFRKNTSEDVRKAVAAILKSFQIEIDSLSKRSKAAEKAFLEIYRHLSELPDPVPALEYAQTLQKRAEKVSDLELENQKLRETLEEYNHEFADVKNQEVTIKQLREKIKDLEEKTESTIQQRLKEKEKELQRLFAEKERQLQSNQFDLVTKYAEMEMRQKQLQQALDHAHQEMFEYKTKQEDANSARAMEIQILNQDLDRSNERALNAERLAEKLREQIDQNQQMINSVSTSNINSDENISQEENHRKLREKLEFELAAKEREIATLVTDTQKLQSTLMKVKETSVSQISDLENVLTAKEKVITQLENRLQNQADYDEIKRELNILKSIEFPSSNRSTDDQTNSNQPKKSLEILLLEKNRALQSEQTQTKVAYADLESNHSLKSSSQIEDMTKTLENPPTNIISLLPSTDNHSLSTPVDTICPTMITPTTPILNAGKRRSSSIENQACIYVGPQLNAVQWTKLHCPSPVNQDIKPIEPLDTTHVSTVVRRILAQHNIGQRVFARCVLTLSQGTVSELLSKPKPWAKLTEKGKESYRKMWIWANSEDSILALKSISPRKGAKENNTQQKGVQILSEPPKTSRSPSTSSTSSRDTSHSEQVILPPPSLLPPQPSSYLPPTMFPTFVPSLLMQTTNRLKNEPYSPYNILCPQPENYRDWLMLQEIFRNNALAKQMKAFDTSDESDLDDNNDENIDETPLDLSMKVDTNKISTNKSNKTTLMPLTEQDLSKYRTINTLELVQSIKDILSRYSISQRHFGEKILGLSQGSVSDILARPKSWELLTQKGREPFIRMRLFLDDSTAIKQLVQSVSLTSPSALTNQFFSNENSIEEQTNDCSQSLTNESLITSTINEISINNNNNNKSKSRPKTTNQNKDQSRLQTKSQIPPYELPKITLPSSIDTEQLSSQVRELLLSHSIGQRVFGEAVLNLSQGTVSEILSKPRPWHALSVKGREPYIRMYTWFHDTDNVQKLLAWKQERDVFRRNVRPTISPSIKSNVDSENPSKRRYLFSDEQRRILKQTFENEQYPSQAKLEQLVEDLSLPMNKISNWFHNARMRAKSIIPLIDTPKPLSRSPINDNDDEENDRDSDDETLPTIVPLTSSWLNGTNDSDSSASPISFSLTNFSSIDEQKPLPSISNTSSSSKKQRYHELNKRCQEYEYSNNELKQLNTQLEKDLLSVGGVTPLFRTGPEGQTSDSNTNETGIMKDVLNQSSAPTISFNETTSTNLKKDSTSDEALTAIVISQRERFRIRNVELENENVSLKQQINIFQNEMDKLRSDNIKLYERIKFIQTYPTTRTGDDAIDRYSDDYQRSLDPFTNFTKQEKQNKYNSLKLHEKFALNFGRFILSSHKSRTFFVIYFILVHILIFLSLYKMVHVGSSVRDMSQVCFDQFREHMAGVHGEKNFHLNGGHAHGGAGAPHR